MYILPGSVLHATASVRSKPPTLSPCDCGNGLTERKAEDDHAIVASPHASTPEGEGRMRYSLLIAAKGRKDRRQSSDFVPLQ